MKNGFPLSLIFFFLILYQSIADIVIVSGGQPRDSARNNHSPPNSPPIQAATEHCAEFPVL